MDGTPLRIVLRVERAELELSVFSNVMVVLIGVIYILSRSIGKYGGAYASAKISKCDDNIVKYLGITLLPQAGVALGMAMKSQELGGELGQLISSITLFAVLIYELVGPMLTKIALTKAGDINPEGATSARHEHAKERGWHHHIKPSKKAVAVETETTAETVEETPQN